MARLRRALGTAEIKALVAKRTVASTSAHQGFGQTRAKVWAKVWSGRCAYAGGHGLRGFQN